MNRLIQYIFSHTSLGKAIDGKKRVIGAVLLVLAAVIEVLGKLAAVFPETAWLSSSSAELSVIYKEAVDYLVLLGVPTLAVGEYHAKIKAKLPEE